MKKVEREKATTKQGKSRIPRFKNIGEAADWLETHDTADYEDEFEEVREPMQFVVRRAPANKAITVRIDEHTMTILAKEASEQGIGPATLVRMWILEHLRQEGASHRE